MEASRRDKTKKNASSSVIWVLGSVMKVLLTVFFECNGVEHHEFLPKGRADNKEYYLEVMRQLQEAIHQKCTELWKNQL